MSIQGFDKFFLRLQCKVRLYKLGGTEFQSFVEDVLLAKDARFTKVRPYGNRGDGGNDGFIREIGHYFQVYAPKDPSTKDQKVAEKFATDFVKLKNNWDQISEVKKYHFAFNDKYAGTSLPLEEVLGELKQQFPEMGFQYIFAEDIERFILQLPEDDLLNLGFTLSPKNSEEAIEHLLEIIQIEIDRENVETAKTFLAALRGIIEAGGSQAADLQYRLLSAACYEQSEDFDQAVQELQKASGDYPKEIRIKTRLSEILYCLWKFEDSRSTFASAEALNPGSPHIRLQKLLAVIRDEQALDLGSIDESTFPEETRLKSTFYRICGLIFAIKEDERAIEYLDKAVQQNPNRFKNHLAVIQVLALKLNRTKDQDERNAISNELLTVIERVIERFGGEEKIRPRNACWLKCVSVQAHFQLGNRFLAHEHLHSLLVNVQRCYLDADVAVILSEMLSMGFLDKRSLLAIEAFIKKSGVKPQKSLVVKLLCQYLYNGLPVDSDESVIPSNSDSEIASIIAAINSNDADKLVELIGKDKALGVELSQSLRNSPLLSARIMRSLDLPKSEADTLLLHHYYKTGNFEDARKILREMDLTTINSGEIQQILPICYRLEAVDVELKLLRRLLQFQSSSSDSLVTKFQIFHALLSVPLLDEAVGIGREILTASLSHDVFSEEQLQGVFYNTLVACINRAKIDDAYCKIGLALSVDWRDRFKSYDLLIGPIPGIYFINEMYRECIGAIVDAVVLNKGIEQSDCARLFFMLTLQLAKHIDFEKEYKLDEVQEGAFVKLSDDSKWLHVGACSLHNVKVIQKESELFIKFMGAKTGDFIDFSTKYSGSKLQRQIEKICSVEGFIFWQIVEVFNELAPQNLLPGVQSVNFPEVDGELDLSILHEMLSQGSSGDPKTFEQFVNGGLPLAVLAVNQGGLLHAVRKIVESGRGYIHATSGSHEELEKQIETASSVLNANSQFYLDGTSALFLVEAGLLSAVLKACPGLLIPASVLNFLISLAERMDESIPGDGSLSLRNGSLQYTQYDEESKLKTKARYTDCIKQIESNKGRIRLISNISKYESPIEVDVPPELSDSCALARRDNVPVLTDDFLYPGVSARLLNYVPVKYFSSLALLRVLAERKIIRHEDYLNFVDVACAYRFRFISMSTDDFVKALFGTGQIKTISLNNLDKLHINFTLSSEYGASQTDCMRIVCQFILVLLEDASVVPEVVEDVFVKIIQSYPTYESKAELATTILSICERVGRKSARNAAIYVGTSSVELKVKRLRQRIDLFASTSRIVVPNPGANSLR